MIRLRATLRTLTALPGDLLLMLITWLPGASGNALRRRYWSRRLGHLGVGTRIDTGVIFQNPSFIHVGDNCWIDRDVTIMAGPDRSTREKYVVTARDADDSPTVRIGANVHVGAASIISGIAAGVSIGDDSGLSAGCRIYAFSHHYRSFQHPDDARFSFGPLVGHDRQALLVGHVTIGTNTGLALGAIVLPGAAIGADSFASVGAIIHRGKYPDNSVLSGCPAKVAGQRFKASHQNAC
jgi:acetyltransferase-like isoleucine patch superfamily enzyme